MSHCSRNKIILILDYYNVINFKFSSVESYNCTPIKSFYIEYNVNAVKWNLYIYNKPLTVTNIFFSDPVIVKISRGPGVY